MRNFIWFLSPFLFAASLFSSEGGTLVVSYKTDQSDRAIEQVRFWLWDAEQNHYFFPRGNAYIDDPNTFGRMVVIEDLPPGEYVVEFMIPNRTNAFTQPPPQRIEVLAGDVAKVDVLFTKQTDLESLVMVSKAVAPTYVQAPGFLFLTYFFNPDHPVTYRLFHEKTGNTIDGPRDNDIVQPMGVDAYQVLVQDLPSGNWQIAFFEEESEPLLESSFFIHSNQTCFIQEDLSSWPKLSSP
ncbi:MAG: hypothetical protein WD595_03420 [Waddliaceae bacterium]